MSKKRQSSTQFKNLQDVDLFGQKSEEKKEVEKKVFLEETERLEDKRSFASEMKRLGVENKADPAFRKEPGIGQIRGREALAPSSSGGLSSPETSKAPSQDKDFTPPSPASDLDKWQRRCKKAEDGEALTLNLLKQAQDQNKELQLQEEALQKKLEESEKALALLRQKVEEKKQSDVQKKREEEAEKAEQPVFLNLRSFLASEGLREEHQSEILRAMIDHYPKDIGRLLHVSSDAMASFLQKHLRRVCDHPECQEESRRQGGIFPVSVSSNKSCEICRGSDNKRAFSRLLSLCERLGLRKLLLVGGSEDSHTEVTSFIQAPFQIRLVNGDDRRFKAQATQDIEWADLVIIWGPTQLPHKISELYTDQRALAAGKLKIVNHRGVALMAQEIIDFLRTWRR